MTADNNYLRLKSLETEHKKRPSIKSFIQKYSPSEKGWE